MRELLLHLTEALDQGREVLFCQVVETRGSTPQKAGAVMVVSPEGGQLGTLGGGCVEAEVKARALEQLGQRGAGLHDFVLDHDYAWADGLICGGRMLILVEALQGPGPASYYHALRRLLEAGQGFTETVVVDTVRAAAPAGAHALFGPDGQLVACWPPDAPASRLAEQLTPLHERPRPATRAGVAWLPTLPRIRLVIVGAGHVGQAVAQLAAQVDFDIWVVDDRRQYCNTERFGMAERLIVGPFEEVLPALEVTPHSFALIVTRGHGHDQEALHHLVTTAASYVGLIGSKRKIRLIFDGLRQVGISEAALERVTAPVGFDIGSQTVPEIAVSIVAELVARRNLGRSTRAEKGARVRPDCAEVDPEPQPEPAGR
jgi:xanthine dehydrogenase accessory factor